LFFLMSGFVMAHVYGQKLASNWRAHWRDFAIMRFARIYPLFAVTTLVAEGCCTRNDRWTPPSRHREVEMLAYRLPIKSGDLNGRYRGLS
jgi:peptidoglycan/LPS O-acetylase OafA/YrhL